jgi:hypothetical protein
MRRFIQKHNIEPYDVMVTLHFFLVTLLVLYLIYCGLGVLEYALQATERHAAFRASQEGLIAQYEMILAQRHDDDY